MQEKNYFNRAPLLVAIIEASAIVNSCLSLVRRFLSIECDTHASKDRTCVVDAKVSQHDGPGVNSQGYNDKRN